MVKKKLIKITFLSLSSTTLAKMNFIFWTPRIYTVLNSILISINFHTRNTMEIMTSNFWGFPKMVKMFLRGKKEKFVEEIRNFSIKLSTLKAKKISRIWVFKWVFWMIVDCWLFSQKILNLFIVMICIKIKEFLNWTWNRLISIIYLTISLNWC